MKKKNSMETQTQNAVLKDLNWRYATKAFDLDKTLSNEILEVLIESVRLSASSYGLQPYHILVISDPAPKQSTTE